MASRMSAFAKLPSTAARAGVKAGHGRKTLRSLGLKPGLSRAAECVDHVHSRVD